MKKIGLITTMITLIISVFSACEKSELPFDKAIEGTYVGTLISTDSQKSKTNKQSTKDAIAEITKIGNSTIQVHLNSVEIDTTFMLKYYEDMDNIWVCFTNDDFKDMYGHLLGQGHMPGGMMGDMHNNETEWMHHLDDEHQENDEHFGGFDMQDQSFGYRINLINGGAPYYLQFLGRKL